MTLQLVTCDALSSLLADNLKKCDDTAFNPAADKIVDCASLPGLISDNAGDVICDLLAAVPAAAAPATPTTRLVGADCQTYVLPPVPVDITVQNLEVVGDTLVLTEDDGTTHEITAAQLLSVLGLADCSKNPIAPGTQVATCADISDMVTNADLVDCAGAALDVSAGIPSCAEFTALQNTVNDLMTIINAAEEIQDCDGTPLGKYLVL